VDKNQRIAIVGVGGVFSGAANLNEFWENILIARDCSREPPEGRWSLALEDVYDARGPQPDKVYSKRACFVDNFEADTDGLEIDAEFLASLDPMFHLLLHAGNQAWRDAVTENLDKQRVGIIIGNIALPTDASSSITDEILLPVFEKSLLGKEDINGSTNLLNKYVAGLPAGTLAQALGLGGGSYTLDAACASSLYALKYAVDELLAGRSDAMLCGGLSRPDSLYTQMGFSALHAISASGRCSPFDKKGDGLVVGEGSGILVLKRLDDALKDADHIYATIAGVGLSNDIDGNLMSPDSEGQLRAMRSAYERANWQASDVDLIECHGTGTPVGDVVEFNSLNSLWGDSKNEDDCVIGSVKSNIGHLLTAAGSAGLIKILLSMKHAKLPPTANYESSSRGIDVDASPFTVLSKPQDWKRRDKNIPRRAAISAFGFGGINAHVLLEEWDESLLQIKSTAKKSKVEASQKSPNIAIVGMDTCFGPWKSLQAFQNRVLGGIDNSEAKQLDNSWGVESNLKGYALDKIEIPVGRFRIPPNELKDMLPQQLLMLQTAANAIDDAGITEEKRADLKNAGVYIGIGLDMNTSNFHLRWCLLPMARQWAKQLGLELTDMQLQKWVGELRDASGPEMNANRTMGALGGIVASRIARAFDIGGPSFTLSSEESSGLRSLEAGVRALQRGEINTAVVGAVDLASDIRSITALGLGIGDDFVIGDGAAALILKRYDEAVQDGDRIYSVIKGLGAASGGGTVSNIPETTSYEKAVERSIVDAGIALDSISLVEMCGNSSIGNADREAKVIQGLFKNTNRDIPCAISSVVEALGQSGAAGALASIVKTSLCLHQRLLPSSASHNNSGTELNDNSALFVPAATQYWLRDREDGERRALVNAFSIDGNCLSAILEGVEEQDATQIRDPLHKIDALFSICADEKYMLIDSLQRLRGQAGESRDKKIQDIACDWWAQEENNQHRALAVSVIASDQNQLIDLLKQAQAYVESDKSISTDRLFYSTKPLADKGKVAFVFPGSGSHFIGMGREMSAHWPELLTHLDQENLSLASQFASSRFWAQKSTANFSHEDYIFGQVWLGAMVSDVIASFSIKPDAVIGYCLGETVGLFATRTWNDRDLMLKRMRETRLFTHDLGGACDAVRETWDVTDEETIDWQLGVVDRPADEVRTALKNRSRVYLLIINTPSECIIGGDRTAVQNLVKDLKCGFHPLEGVTTVHCEVVKPVELPYRELHLFKTTPPEGVAFYSGIAGSQYQVTTENAADSIVRQALETFDYTKLINAAYDDGVRIFIEMGPGASCSRMIGQILGDREHIARSVCVNGQSDVANVLKLLAQLNAERIPVDLSSLYQEPNAVDIYAGHNKISVEVGKKPFDIPLPPEQKPNENRSEQKQSQTPVESEKTAKLYTHPGVARQADPMSQFVEQMLVVEAANAEAQDAFLKVSNGIAETMSDVVSLQMSLMQSVPDSILSSVSLDQDQQAPGQNIAFDRNMCMEFAIGSIAKMLGPQFAQVDSYPTRVRLPDEPLMLVDRIIEVEGEACSMSHGRVVTEHDVLDGAWYLDSGRIPTCIAVEAGQADLFLSGYLGIDLQTHGLAVYRLLDAEVCFHDPLPHAGQIINYDIHIDHFFRQGDTWLFRFGFDGTVNGQPLITMRNGCAGFFTQAELDAGRGIVRTSLETRSLPGKRKDDWSYPVAMDKESYNDNQINALRKADLASCFGPAFENLSLTNPSGLPGGKMTLVHRILSLEPEGGRFGLGIITGEADIHPDDWFLTCHFIDDQVMPGTLMYECCLHTLRVYLLRMGWVGEADEFVYEPVIGVTSKLKCRGQVLATTKKVQYEISLKEIGYTEDNNTPYVIADALMYGDDKAIVQMSNMSLQLTGLNRQRIEAIWAETESDTDASPEKRETILFDYDSINAFAVGDPSAAFGDKYKIFDKERVIARLPGPPFQFLDRIISIKDCEQWQLKAGAVIEGQYDVPADAWYFAADRQKVMPFSVLLEIALQPCGWLAAYLGSALTSDIDMSFRNLGGKARQLLAVGRDTGSLTIKIKITNVALSGGMIIQNYDFEVRSAQGVVYVGDTYFGFFSKAALADQVGIREVQPYEPNETETARALQFAYPEDAPYPDDQMRMVNRVECFDVAGGPHGLGFIRGTAEVNPDAWFFKAHFHQDPVWPGSLGLESFMQLLKVVAQQRWGEGKKASKYDFQCMALGQQHSWLYRGQILPSDERVTVQAVITHINDEEKQLVADGFLSVDGRIIYQMNDFALRMTES
jgi:PfaB family protein